MERNTREPQYQYLIELAAKHVDSFGLMSNQAWFDDPKRLAFLFSRYKFVAKMFSGLNRVLEVGCADAFATRVVLQEVKSLTACDFDPVFVADVHQRMHPRWKFECIVHDMLAGPVAGQFDGAYSIDVLEHIPPADEDRFIANIVRSLNPHGVLMIGSPSIQSQAYASGQSKAGHVNCKDAPALKALLSKFFHNVFIFSMNDEVVHTGFYPMAQYLFALCCHPK
jgi:2-polyprenyl-3-methyl-5-hydroxy-6-metoxy-1,4-benzoquinol methylase